MVALSERNKSPTGGLVENNQPPHKLYVSSRQRLLYSKELSIGEEYFVSPIALANTMRHAVRTVAARPLMRVRWLGVMVLASCRRRYCSMLALVALFVGLPSDDSMGRRVYSLLRI